MSVYPRHSGDGCPNSGDSGGPIILNASGVAETSSASDIAGLPDGQPLVAGDYNSGATGLGATTCDPSESTYAASWDAVESPSAGAPVTGDTQTGFFLNASTSDWDQDQVDDADDKCPIAWQHDQSDCNAVAELALGYPERGDACDPVPCAAVTAPITQFVSLPLSTQTIRDTLDLTLLPSNRVAAQDHNIDITPPVSPIMASRRTSASVRTTPASP